MSDAFVNGFCLTLVGKVPERKMHIIRDALNSYIIGFDIKPITTSLTTTYYKLPNEYYIYMAAKTQDGKMRNGTKYQYASCLEKMLYRFWEDKDLFDEKIYLFIADNCKKFNRQGEKTW